MANRKKTHHGKKSHHSRRMSGVKGGGVAMEVLAIAGGAIAAKFLTKALAGKVNDKVLSGIVLAGGVFLPKFVKGDFGKGLGAGMIATGSIGMLNSFGVLQGIGAPDDSYTMEFISGTDELHTISDAGELDHENEFAMAGAGVGELTVLSGVDDGEEMKYATGSEAWMQGLND